jgi:hypothetical protein
MAIVKEQHGNEQPIAGAQPESKVSDNYLKMNLTSWNFV